MIFKKLLNLNIIGRKVNHVNVINCSIFTGINTSILTSPISQRFRSYTIRWPRKRKVGKPNPLELEDIP